MKLARKRLSHAVVIKALETGYPIALGSAEVTSLLGISKNSLYTAVRNGEFPEPLPISNATFKVWGTKEVAQWMRDHNIPFPTLAGAE